MGFQCSKWVLLKGKHQRYAKKKKFKLKCSTTDTIWLAVMGSVVFCPSPLMTYSLMIKQINAFYRPETMHCSLGIAANDFASVC